jgi:hypothetical protein
MLCVYTAFGHFSLNLVWTSCIPTSSVAEHLMVETYRGCVNGFTYTDMFDFSFAWLFVKIPRVPCEGRIKDHKVYFILKILEVLQVMCP